MTTRPAPPEVIRLAPDVFDRLQQLVQWIEAIPDQVSLGDRTWERIDELIVDPVQEEVPASWDVLAVQFEDAATAAVAGTNPGDFVALLCWNGDEDTDEGDITEFHVRIVRATGE